MAKLLKFGVLGSGFGLYGYVPSIILSGLGSVILSNHTKKVFNKRKELKKFGSQICWVKDENQVVKQSNVLAIVRPPKQQVHWIRRALKQNNTLRHLFLEKPLAHNPNAAYKIANQLKKWCGRHDVAYIFCVLPWARKLLAMCKKKDNIEIKWQFMANHFSSKLNSWKKNHKQGGGPLRFYGIHLIALLAEAGYKSVSASRLSLTSWTATFCHKNLAQINVQVNSRSSREAFSIQTKSRKRIQLFWAKNPFLTNLSGSCLDARVPTLRKYLKNAFAKKSNSLQISQSLQLWKQVEKHTKYEK